MPRATYPRPWIATGHGSLRELRAGECELKFRDEVTQRHLILPCSVEEARALIESRTRNRRRLAAGLPAVTTWAHAIEAHEKQLRADARSQKYVDEFGKMMRELRDHADVELNRIQSAHIQAWLNDFAIESQGKKRRGWQTTGTKRRAICSAFFRALKSALGHNPMEGVKKFDAIEHPKRDLTIEEFKRVRRVCEPSLRDLLNFLVYTGCRLGEAANMKRSDVNDAGVWQVAKRKRGIVLKINLSERGLLEIVLRQRPDAAGRIWRRWVAPKPETTKGFNLGDAIDSSWFTKTVTERCKRAKVPKFTAHALRHAKASWSEELGIDLRTIQKSLGHTNINTTQRYAHGQSSRRVLEAQELLIDQLTERVQDGPKLWQEEDEPEATKQA